MRRLLVFLCVMAAPLFAQSVVSLGNWRVMTGDDARWAEPDYNDSHWPEAPSPQRLNGQQTFVGGFRWYRAQASLPLDMRAETLAFGIGPVDEVFDVFVNGMRIGTFGEWTPAPMGYFPRSLSFPIPTTALRGSMVHVAIRRWTGANRTNFASLGLTGSMRVSKPPEIGPAALVTTRQELQASSGLNSSLADMLAGAGLIAVGLLSLALFFAQDAGRDKLWLGLALASAGLPPLLGLGAELAGLPLRGSQAAFAVCLQYGSGTLWALFLASICPRLGLPLRVTATATAIIAVWLGWSFYLQLPSYGLYLPWSYLELAAPLAVSFALMTDRQSAQSRMLAAALILEPAAYFWSNQVALWLHLSDTERYFYAGFLVIDPRNVARLVFAFVALSVFYARYRREQRRQSAVELEIAAARLVQESLLLGGEAEIPGFRVEAEYLPASEVGGDFYQVLPVENGAFLIAVGDVSGKGLRAAMVVSMVVGLLRSHRQLSPGALLEEINRTLFGSLHGGFVTCVAARIESDGQAVVANAGHPAPYGGGSEIAVESGLPLGIVETEYRESRMQIGSLTLFSDGVIEAANVRRELFGFDRTCEISGRSASEIAEAARAWGQNDDITVVTLRRMA